MNKTVFIFFISFALQLTTYDLRLFNYCVAQCTFKTIGHKGGSCYNYPDNTLYAIEQSFTEGVWAAEVDVRETSDGVLILCHEGSIEKATNSFGFIDALPYSYIKTLDAGSWKDKRFAGVNIPTLVDALKLAHKYNRKLYLDVVGWHPEQIAKAIKDAGVPPDICFPDPRTLEEISGYHAVLPEMPLVYFGDPPADINDAGFYQFLKDNGVIAAELYYGDILDTITYPLSKTYRDNLHKYGMELWVYTVNDISLMKALKDFGIDGIESDRPAALKDIFCNKGDGGFFPEKRITGQWDFNNKNLIATVGSKLIEGGDTSLNSRRVAFNTTKGFGLPDIKGNVTNVMLVPGFDSNHSIQFFSNIYSEDIPSSFHDYNYSIIMDILKPATSTKPYIALFQTDDNNVDDATVFIRKANRGIGIFDSYDGYIADNTWYRIALVFDVPNHRFDKYIDGKYVGTTPINPSGGGKFGLNNNWSGWYSLLFSDNNGETDTMFVSSIQVRSYAMDSVEVSGLGSVSYEKIPQSIRIDSSYCPVIILQPNDTMFYPGTDVCFTTKASKNVNYLWQMNTNGNWTDIIGINYSDKASSVLKISDVPQSFNNTLYRCIISNNCSVTSNSVTLKITTLPVIYGILNYNNVATTPIKSTKVNLYNSEGKRIDSTTTNTSGFYRFFNIDDGKYILKPDIKAKSGGFNPTDALLVNRNYITLYQFKDELKKKAADVNEDTDINPTDALLINRRYIGILKSFKPTNWKYQSDTITVKGADINYNIKAICTGDVNGSF